MARPFFNPVCLARCRVSITKRGDECFHGGVDKKIALYTPEFYATCAVGGALSCGLTHTLVTPLDLVKCRRQVRVDAATAVD